MTDIFVLHHVHQLGDEEDAKLIGVYSTREHADAAIGRLSTQSGFRNHPDGFHIDLYTLNEDHWTEGFATVR